MHNDDTCLDPQQCVVELVTRKVTTNVRTERPIYWSIDRLLGSFVLFGHQILQRGAEGLPGRDSTYSRRAGTTFQATSRSRCFRGFDAVLQKWVTLLAVTALSRHRFSANFLVDGRGHRPWESGATFVKSALAASTWILIHGRLFSVRWRQRHLSRM